MKYYAVVVGVLFLILFSNFSTAFDIVDVVAHDHPEDLCKYNPDAEDLATNFYFPILYANALCSSFRYKFTYSSLGVPKSSDYDSLFDIEYPQDFENKARVKEAVVRYWQDASKFIDSAESFNNACNEYYGSSFKTPDRANFVIEEYNSLFNTYSSLSDSRTRLAQLFLTLDFNKMSELLALGADKVSDDNFQQARYFYNSAIALVEPPTEEFCKGTPKDSFSDTFRYQACYSAQVDAQVKAINAGYYILDYSEVSDAYEQLLTQNYRTYLEKTPSDDLHSIFYEFFEDIMNMLSTVIAIIFPNSEAFSSVTADTAISDITDFFDLEKACVKRESAVDSFAYSIAIQQIARRKPYMRRLAKTLPNMYRDLADIQNKNSVLNNHIYFYMQTDAQISALKQAYVSERTQLHNKFRAVDNNFLYVQSILQDPTLSSAFSMLSSVAHNPKIEGFDQHFSDFQALYRDFNVVYRKPCSPDSTNGCIGTQLSTFQQIDANLDVFSEYISNISSEFGDLVNNYCESALPLKKETMTKLYSDFKEKGPPYISASVDDYSDTVDSIKLKYSPILSEYISRFNTEFALFNAQLPDSQRLLHCSAALGVYNRFISIYEHPSLQNIAPISKLDFCIGLLSSKHLSNYENSRLAYIKSAYSKAKANGDVAMLTQLYSACNTLLNKHNRTVVDKVPVPESSSIIAQASLLPSESRKDVISKYYELLSAVKAGDSAKSNQLYADIEDIFKNTPISNPQIFSTLKLLGRGRVVTNSPVESKYLLIIKNPSHKFFELPLRLNLPFKATKCVSKSKYPLVCDGSTLTVTVPNLTPSGVSILFSAVSTPVTSDQTKLTLMAADLNVAKLYSVLHVSSCCDLTDVYAGLQDPLLPISSVDIRSSLQTTLDLPYIHIQKMSRGTENLGIIYSVKSPLDLSIEHISSTALMVTLQNTSQYTLSHTAILLLDLNAQCVTSSTEFKIYSKKLYFVGELSAFAAKSTSITCQTQPKTTVPKNKASFSVPDWSLHKKTHLQDIDVSDFAKIKQDFCDLSDMATEQGVNVPATAACEDLTHFLTSGQWQDDNAYEQYAQKYGATHTDSIKKETITTLKQHSDLSDLFDSAKRAVKFDIKDKLGFYRAFEPPYSKEHISKLENEYSSLFKSDDTTSFYSDLRKAQSIKTKLLHYINDLKQRSSSEIAAADESAPESKYTLLAHQKYKDGAYTDALFYAKLAQYSHATKLPTGAAVASKSGFNPWYILPALLLSLSAVQYIRKSGKKKHSDKNLRLRVLKKNF